MKSILVLCLSATAAAQTPSIFALEGGNAAAVATDSQSNIYVVGNTNSTNFPATGGALQSSLNGPSDAFIAKLSPAGEILWATYFGGSNADFAAGVAIDSAGNILVAGNTSSSDLPVLDAYQSTLGGTETAFLLKLSPAGKILYCTYLGANETATALAVDSAGAAYVAGRVPSVGVITKLSASGALVYSYQSPESTTEFLAIAVDGSGNAYLAGAIGSGNFDQALVLKLSPDGSAPVYETHIGGSQYNYADAIAVDATGAAYIAGGTSSLDFPLVSPLQSTLGARPLWKSTDGGNTWTPIDNLPFSMVQALVADPASPQTLYVGASDTGVFESTDGGQTWTAINSGITPTTVSQLIIDPANPAVLYAGAIGQVYRTANGGASWSLSDYFDTGLTEIAIDPLQPSTIYAIGPSAKSTDGGNTWSALNPPPFGIAQFLVDPVTEGTLYAYSNAAAVAFEGVRPKVQGFVESQLYRSIDGGNTWQEASTPAALPGLHADPTTKPATIYAGDGARSNDGGNTWTALAAPPVITNPTAMTVDSITGAVYVAGTPAIGPVAMAASTNQGRNWTQLPIPSQLSAISGIASAPAALYATNNQGYWTGLVLKLSPDGSTIVYSTYLGGHAGPTGQNEANAVAGIALDADGNIAVTGYTLTADFPTANPAQSSFQGSVDAFLAEISADGQTLNYSTYLGTSNVTNGAALTLDPQGNLIAIGPTTSSTILGAEIPFDTSIKPEPPSAFIAKLSLKPATPAPAIEKVVSAASFQPGIEAGSWVMIQGTALANDTRVWQSSDFTGNDLPTKLDNVSVTIDGVPAYVEYISPTQINVLAPADSNAGPVKVIVTNNGAVSAPATAQLQTYAPAFFLNGTSVAASVLPSFATVTAAAPAMPGDLVVLWGTGFGPTTPTASAGVVVSGAPSTATTPTVTVGGMNAPVISSVLSNGSAGLYQITIQLPANVPTGAVPVQASIGGQQTQAGTTILIGQP